MLDLNVLDYTDSFYLNGEYVRPKDAAAYARKTGKITANARLALTALLNINVKLPETVCLPSFLEPHQREGIIHALTRTRSYLAHAPGAGKTVQTIVAALNVEEKYRKNYALIVCPPNLVENWIREIRLWTHKVQLTKKFSISVVRTGPNETCHFDHRADFILCPDSLIARHEVLTAVKRLRPGVIAYDEASRVKGPNSQRCTAFLFSGLQSICRHFILLDGSPLTLGAIDLWAPTYACDPEAIDFMNLEEFSNAYTVRSYSHGRIKYSGSQNMEELRRRLLSRFMHQVKEEDLAHAERDRTIHLVGESNPTTEAFGEEGLRQLGRMPELDDVDAETLAEYRRMVGQDMVKHTIDFVKAKLKRRPEKILIYAFHRDVCDELARFFKTEPLYGGIHSFVREKVIADFKAKKGAAVLVGQVDYMSRGHNIQEGTRIVFAEYSWSDEVNKQAEKRVSRMGNDDFWVPCDYLALKDSVAERILRSVLRKSRDFNSLFGVGKNQT